MIEVTAVNERASVANSDLKVGLFDQGSAASKYQYDEHTHPAEIIKSNRFWLFCALGSAGMYIYTQYTFIKFGRDLPTCCGQNGTGGLVGLAYFCIAVQCVDCVYLLAMGHEAVIQSLHQTFKGDIWGRHYFIFMMYAFVAMINLGIYAVTFHQKNTLSGIFSILAFPFALHAMGSYYFKLRKFGYQDFSTYQKFSTVCVCCVILFAAFFQFVVGILVLYRVDYHEFNYVFVGSVNAYGYNSAGAWAINKGGPYNCSANYTYTGSFAASSNPGTVLQYCHQKSFVSIPTTISANSTMFCCSWDRE